MYLCLWQRSSMPQTGLHANPRPRGCVIDLFCNYIMAVNSSWCSCFAQEAEKKKPIACLLAHSSLPFFCLSFFITTHFLSPVCCCLGFTAGLAEWWLPQDGHANIWIPAMQIQTTLMCLHTMRQERTTTSQMWLLLHKYLIFSPDASGFLTSCSV